MGGECKDSSFLDPKKYPPAARTAESYKEKSEMLYQSWLVFQQRHKEVYEQGERGKYMCVASAGQVVEIRDSMEEAEAACAQRKGEGIYTKMIGCQKPLMAAGGSQCKHDI